MPPLRHRVRVGVARAASRIVKIAVGNPVLKVSQRIVHKNAVGAIACIPKKDLPLSVGIYLPTVVSIAGRVWVRVVGMT